MTPYEIALKVTTHDGKISYPSYESYGLDCINEIINANLIAAHVATVEIININALKVGA